MVFDIRYIMVWTGTWQRCGVFVLRENSRLSVCGDESLRDLVWWEFRQRSNFVRLESIRNGLVVRFRCEECYFVRIMSIIVTYTIAIVTVSMHFFKRWTFNPFVCECKLKIYTVTSAKSFAIHRRKLWLVHLPIEIYSSVFVTRSRVLCNSIFKFLYITFVNTFRSAHS